MRCLPCVSQLKAGESVFTGHYMNYRLISSQQFIPLLRNFCHSIHIDSRDTRGKNTTLCICGWVSFVLFWYSEKSSILDSTEKTFYDGCLKLNRVSIFKGFWSTTWEGFLRTCTNYWGNHNSSLLLKCRSGCETCRYWLLRMCCANNCRDCSH